MSLAYEVGKKQVHGREDAGDDIQSLELALCCSPNPSTAVLLEPIYTPQIQNCLLLPSTASPSFLEPGHEHHNLEDQVQCCRPTQDFF